MAFDTLQVKAVVQIRSAIDRIINMAWVGKLTFYSSSPLIPMSDLKILLCLTPDELTRQRATPWGLRASNLLIHYMYKLL